MEFVGRKMVARFEKRAQDCVALGRLFQPYTFEMAVKDLLRFTNHLSGNGGLVVNALLQHGSRVRIPFRHIENKIHFQRPPRALAYNQTFFMSTMAEIRTPSARRFSVVRILLWLLLAVLVLLSCVLGYAYYAAHAALPQLDGQLQ